jgi:hypothetical protein
LSKSTRHKVYITPGNYLFKPLILSMTIRNILTGFLALCSIRGIAQQNRPTNQNDMTKQDFNTTLVVAQSPQEVFAAIINVRGWWSEEIDGATDKLNAEFNYHFQDVHRAKIKIVAFVPDRKVVWLVEDNYFKFTKDKTQWTGTRIIFDIVSKGNQTELHFTHEGLTPQYECYEICRDAWTNYIRHSLKSLIETGKGMPNSTGKPQTGNEKKLGSEQH